MNVTGFIMLKILFQKTDDPAFSILKIFENTLPPPLSFLERPFQNSTIQNTDNYNYTFDLIKNHPLY